VLLDLGSATVEALQMNHGTPTLAWIVREKTKTNIDITRLASLGLRPGPPAEAADHRRCWAGRSVD
jgi:ribonuclease Z